MGGRGGVGWEEGRGAGVVGGRGRRILTEAPPPTTAHCVNGPH